MVMQNAMDKFRGKLLARKPEVVYAKCNGLTRGKADKENRRLSL
jgi:hypothetical protein